MLLPHTHTHINTQDCSGIFVRETALISIHCLKANSAPNPFLFNLSITSIHPTALNRARTSDTMFVTCICLYSLSITPSPKPQAFCQEKKKRSVSNRHKYTYICVYTSTVIPRLCVNMWSRPCHLSGQLGDLKSHDDGWFVDPRRLSKDAEEGRLFTDWWYVAERRWFCVFCACLRQYGFSHQRVQGCDNRDSRYRPCLFNQSITQRCPKPPKAKGHSTSLCVNQWKRGCVFLFCEECQCLTSALFAYGWLTWKTNPRMLVSLMYAPTHTYIPDNLLFSEVRTTTKKAAHAVWVL